MNNKSSEDKTLNLKDFGKGCCRGFRRIRLVVKMLADNAAFIDLGGGMATINPSFSPSITK